MGKIRIAAVGDLMAKPKMIAGSRQSDGTYRFDTLFENVSPYLKKADLAIGNLETNFASGVVKGRSAGSIGPRFTCPDSFAGTLKKAGFDVLVTANNHCLDYGVKGLMRTLRVLDQNGIAHTGTYRTRDDSRKYLVRKVGDFSIGILSYTTGTNRNPVPSGKQWMIRRLWEKDIIRDLRAMKRKADFIIVYPHFGEEYRHSPNKRQQRLVRLMFKHGANLVLGSHPHVLQPAKLKSDRKFVIYSMGNFVCTRLRGNIYTQSGVIVEVDVRKDDKGRAVIDQVNCLSTTIEERGAGRRMRVIVIRDELLRSDKKLTDGRRKKLNRLLKHSNSVLNGRYSRRTNKESLPPSKGKLAEANDIQEL
ncbi:CapA family protein [Paenibacillus sp. NPDC058071]|uniref:CapA family protein n=1 Tax=Paenibacillus sp. NPDC058071 TaxID=3346326 RepID=UPI0036DCBBF9